MLERKDACGAQRASEIFIAPREVERHLCHTRNVADVGLERTGPAIRAVLAEHAPDDLAEFEAEFRIALAEADEDFDLARVDAVITKWWGRAHLRLHPPTEAEKDAVARAAAGDDSGLLTRTGRAWKQH